MKIGDLVKWNDRMTRTFKSLSENDVGIILEIQQIRYDDSIRVMWSDGIEWIWRKELERINETR